MAKLDSLTSLRFFAALWVVLFHSRDQFNCLWDLSRNIVFSQAVTFFFVLSGFILAYVYPDLSTRQEKGSYYLKRIGRIWPLHVLCLLTVVLCLPPGIQLEPGSSQNPYPLLFFTNLFLIQSWILSEHFYFSFNPPAWSLSNELFFYVILPLILVPLNKKVISIQIIPLLVCLLIVLSLCNFANALNLPLRASDMVSLQSLLGVNPIVRTFDFCLGVSVGFLFSKCKDKIQESLNSTSATLLELTTLLVVLLAILNTSAITDATKKIWFIANAGSYWLRESGLVIVPFALLIFILALERGLLSKLLSAPYLVILGEISFAIYLWHFPLIKAFYAYIPHERSLRAFFLYLVILFSLSYLTYKLWESPLRNIFSQTANKEKIELKFPKFDKSIAVSLVLLGLCTFFVKEPIQSLSIGQITELKNQKNFTTSDKVFSDTLKLNGYTRSNTPFGKRMNTIWTDLDKSTFDKDLLVLVFNDKNELFHQQQLKLCCPDKKEASNIKSQSWVLSIELPERAYSEATKMTLRTNMGEESFTLEH
ncbi:MAG: acyltransferase [Cyanobacteria bacterium TGS_CYA1]|nr:acyltransferase [Cyanobacteria bacterium TGS_CYA1]